MKPTRTRRRVRHLAAYACLMQACAPWLAGNAGHAADIDTGNPDWTVRWDNTLKYTTMYRLQSPDQAVAGSVRNNNLDDGDLNFDQGFVSNRVDLLSEVDVAWRRTIGARVSAATWYDAAYSGTNDNNSPGTANALTHAHNKFADDTRDVAGRRVELLDAFVYGSFDMPWDTSLSARVGQHTALYGETLFLGANGVAAAQTPININTLLSAPSSQFKEIAIPVPQISTKWQVSPALTLGGYYQFTWRRDRLPPAGSYFSAADVVGDGAEVLYPDGGGPGSLFFDRGKDIEARDSGQGGVQARFKVGSNWEFGLYAARFHSKSPKIYVRPGATSVTSQGVDLGEYNLVYPQDTDVYGISFATEVAETNVSGEVSVRNNQPLAGANGDVYVDSTGMGDNDKNPLYPVGRTFHAERFGNLGAVRFAPVGGGQRGW